MEFGASDLGGPKDEPPSTDSDPTAKLADEKVKRSIFSRWFAAIALAILSLSAVSCLGFAMYVGCHFLGVLDDVAKRDQAGRVVASVAGQVKKIAEPASVKSESSGSPILQAPPVIAASKKSEDVYLKILAPLIPASFSSALAIILFITVARLVTNFERIGREDSEKSKTEDYGAIATLIQEIGKMIQTLKGKG